MKKLVALLITPFLLTTSGYSIISTSSQNIYKPIFPEIKVACLYERVTDWINFNRSIDDVISILNETKTDFIFRGWWRWSPCPDDANMTLPPDFPSNYVENCVRRGYTYKHLENAIKRIKEKMPSVIFCGAVPSQIITRLTWNPITKEFFGTNETWAMALNPQKWGINMTKEEFQYEFAKWHLWVDPNSTLEDYDYRKVNAYFPDITNEDFQELLLSWAYKQIDCGVDAIWIDMLFAQANMLYKITGDIYHPAVKESYEAACKIVDEIHGYGESKGKYIYVGTWSACAIYPYEKPSLDFITASPSSTEVYEMKMNETKWDERISIVREKFGDIPFFAFIDWASTTHTPLGVFSQYLSKEEQREFLKIADIFFAKKGINFIYPVHGGWMGNDAEILSYGISRTYDSLAPEFETYETIVKLTQNKAEGKPFICIKRPENYIYVFDREIAPSSIPTIIGKITIKVDAFDLEGIEKVEFYTDGNLKYNDSIAPYEWTWDEFSFGEHEIKVTAYDDKENVASDEINVFILNF